MSNLIATYTMTMPPSVNGQYRTIHAKKRLIIKSKIARDWINQTITTLQQQKSHPTITKDLFLNVKISPKTKARQDIDNRNKGIFDALVASGIIQDDSQVQKLLIEFDYTKKDFVSVGIYEYP